MIYRSVPVLFIVAVCFVRGHVLDQTLINSRSGNEDSGNNNEQLNRVSQRNNRNENQEDPDNNRTAADVIDDEDMVGNFTNITTRPDISPRNTFLQVRERDRQFRLEVIRQRILRRLGWTRPPIIPEELLRTVNATFDPQIITENVVQEHRRCLSASCVLPRQIDDHLWGDEALSGFRVYAGLEHAQHITQHNLHTANLNVFLRHQPGMSCHGYSIEQSHGGSLFLVSIYQFMRPLRFQRSRNRVLNRKRLIDAQMVRTNQDTWMTFDVKRAVVDWVSRNRHNFGFEIIVKDENETECNSLNMFHPVECDCPEEIGCREESDNLPISPFFQDPSNTYFPYLEIVTRQSSVRRRSRLRNRRDLSSELHNGWCAGREERINILELNPNVIAPTSYSTLVCEGHCATAGSSSSRVQVSSSRCRPTESRPVFGLYLTSTSRVRFGSLSLTKVVQCGC